MNGVLGMNWDFFNKPGEQGWYAVLICYDPQEGVFPSAGYWDGQKWDRKAVSGFGVKRDTELEAKALAYEHDPDI